MNKFVTSLMIGIALAIVGSALAQAGVTPP
jgi:hypothetical protein